MNTVFGLKKQQSQVFLTDGTRVPVTVVSILDNVITQQKVLEKDGYTALQIGIGSSKKSPKSLMGQLKKSSMKNAPSFIREVRTKDDEDLSSFALGSTLTLSEILTPGDQLKVTGTSKGKGFAGGVKRYGFGGGPKTHGQSDRHRAPGAIGQGTTPGRVYKGKRMAGRMGSDTVSVTNLYVVDIQGTDVYVSGLIPGNRNALVRLEKTGEKKNFVPVFKIQEETETPEVPQETPSEKSPVEEVNAELEPTPQETSKEEQTKAEATTPEKPVSEETASQPEDTEKKEEVTDGGK